MNGERVPQIIVFALLSVASMHAQIVHGTEPLPSFEVATVRPWLPPPPPPPGEEIVSERVMKVSPGAPGGQATDRVHLLGDAEILIALAYGLPVASYSRIIGAPDWVNSQAERYEVQAKIDAAQLAEMQKMTPSQQWQQVSLMEQSLLAERFKLKVHFEMREMPVYALVIAKGGPKLTPAQDGETNKVVLVGRGGSEMTATAETMDQLARSPFLVIGGHSVVDQTGLKGTYDFKLSWGPDDPSAAGDSSQPPLLTAIQQQLGLKIVQTKGPAEVVVIDHIEKPTGN